MCISDYSVNCTPLYAPGMGGTDGVGGMGGAAGGMPGIDGGGGVAGAKSARSSGTSPAGVHAAIPCFHTNAWGVSCPVGTNDYNVG